MNNYFQNSIKYSIFKISSCFILGTFHKVDKLSLVSKVVLCSQSRYTVMCQNEVSMLKTEKVMIKPLLAV